MNNLKIIFLDRDGVLNIDTGYPSGANAFHPYPDTVKHLHILKNEGYDFIIVTNQSGIGRGMYSVYDFHNFQRELYEYYAANNIYFKKTYFCPHSPNEYCNCRKPKPGLLLDAIEEFKLDRSRCHLIGDKSTDLLAGHRVGLKKSFLLTSPKFWNNITQEIINASSDNSS